jgi:carboxylate-amine ligase
MAAVPSPAAHAPAPPSPDPAAAEAALRAPFDELRAAFTVGVEEELMLLEPGTLALAPVAGAVVAATGGDPRFRQELPAAQVEIVTPVCATAGAIGRELLGARRALLAATGGRVRLAGAGTHPFAPAEGPTSHGARYDAIAAEYQWAARRGLAWGLHVHVAVPGSDRALAVHDALRSHLPELAALAGNAPFHEGRDTGLHSVRPKLAEGFPRQGIPPAHASWERFADLLAWGRRGGAVPEPSHLWWEVRLQPRLGTLEVRVFDQPATAGEAAALAAVVQALCAWLASRHDEDRLPAPGARERIEENRWRALRHGLDGELLDLVTGAPEPTRRRVARLLGTLEPVAAGLGAGDAFAGAWSLLERTGSDRQRAAADAARAAGADGPRAALEHLVARLEAEAAG